MNYSANELRRLFWEEDRAEGGFIRRQYDEIKTILEDKDRKWVEKQYLKIKQHAIEQVPFYKGKKLEEPFPVLDKIQIIKEYESHRAKAGFQEPIHIASTSGSTGTPFSVIQDKNKRKRVIAELQVFGELCNYPSRERMIYFRALNDKHLRTAETEERENIFFIDSSDLGEKQLGVMTQEILCKKPRIIFSYPSTMIELAKYISRQRIAMSDFSMKSVLVGGEVISENDRSFLNKVFGCPVYRRYSDMELGIFGQDRGDGKEYILNWGSYYFECLQMNEDIPVRDGEVGRIVITDLFNYAFPMIRYDTGDLGIMNEEGDDFPVLNEVFGRRRDCVFYPDGRMLSPAKISVSMWGCDGIRQWQFIQNAANQYTIRVSIEKEINQKGLIDKFKDLLGEDASITIECVDEIPVISSSKRRAIICNL